MLGFERACETKLAEARAVCEEKLAATASELETIEERLTDMRTDIVKLRGNIEGLSERISLITQRIPVRYVAPEERGIRK